MTDYEAALARYSALAMLAHIECAHEQDTSHIDSLLRRLEVEFPMLDAIGHDVFDIAMMVDGDARYTGTVEVEHITVSDPLDMAGTIALLSAFGNDDDATH